MVVLCFGQFTLEIGWTEEGSDLCLPDAKDSDESVRKELANGTGKFGSDYGGLKGLGQEVCRGEVSG